MDDVAGDEAIPVRGRSPRLLGEDQRSASVCVDEWRWGGATIRG